ncbi:hypothetical protein [Amycolatopsis sp. PS_44_ISF1]|uniref:hypothetical protein n=1 Tax=Amycolatopsis sp. PS_44_ISF1 TaxID=2974917 RepID=UPI0028DD539F|nr:hypothetical protein [Amycolatopsis sp. PS_44_ISF1]MDT8910032.1 hypothetical protein [Amycolatopsis sp. PS_44_ISF1]
MVNTVIHSWRVVRRSAHRPALRAAAGFAALIPVTVAGLLADPRSLGGQPIWEKPFKFSVSLALYLGTIALLVPLVRRRGRRVAGGAATAIAVAMSVEMALILTQVVRGRASHFNFSTPADTVIAQVMGAGAIVAWLLTAVLAGLLLRERTLPAPLHRALGLGLLVALAGMSVAFLMVVPTAAQLAAAPAHGVPVLGGHAVGVADGGPGLPLLGWSTTGGDLRIGHFVGLHALQGLPLLALALKAAGRRWRPLASESVQARLVTVAAGGWLGLTGLLTWQALRAQPLLAPDSTTLATLTGLVLAVAGATTLVLRHGPGRFPKAPVVSTPNSAVSRA